jgi:hypothetical protein
MLDKVNLALENLCLSNPNEASSGEYLTRGSHSAIVLQEMTVT